MIFLEILFHKQGLECDIILMSFDGDASVKAREVDSLEDAIVWELITLYGKTAKSFPPPIA